MLANDGAIKVLDFGIAKVLGEAPLERVAENPAVLVDDKAVTRAGDILGTLPYMPPEQVRAQAIDHRPTCGLSASCCT